MGKELENYLIEYMISIHTTIWEIQMKELSLPDQLSVDPKIIHTQDAVVLAAPPLIQVTLTTQSLRTDSYMYKKIDHSLYYKYILIQFLRH